jgi:transcriptional regulator with GAF, ATPase, and Fis domain
MASEEESTKLVPALAVVGRALAASLDGALRVFELPESGRLVVGRSSDADVLVDHASISRKHVVLHLSAAEVRVEDLGSANGTVVGGRRLAKGGSEVLAPGTSLELGSVLFTLQDARAAVAESEDAQKVARLEAIVADPAMVEVHETVRVAAGSTLSVLLLGETGVGKEVIARRVHELSSRRELPLVRVNCAALVESLLEAELFGYERGAFTGAVQAKPGLLEVASGGTLFLDEVGELPLPIQAKLLLVLESGEVTRVGALKPKVVDVRFVSATHRDVRSLVASGRFREDLFFRLDGVSIRIPPLRERRAEILPLARSFLASSAKAANKPAPTLTEAAEQRLLGHGFPGNVRELRNVIQRSVLFCTAPSLDAADLRFDALGGSIAPPPAEALAATATPAKPNDPSLADMPADRLERRERVIKALDATVWNQTRAAEALGISRRTLQSWMIELRIPRPRSQR